MLHQPGGVGSLDIRKVGFELMHNARQVVVDRAWADVVGHVDSKKGQSIRSWFNWVAMVLDKFEVGVKG